MISRNSSGNLAIAKLVERQMRNWELARDQRLPESKSVQKQVEDFICISRQVGTEGMAVARGLAAGLEWPIFDREILDAMAGDDEVRRQIYESMDERDLSWWEETLRALMQSEFVRNDYFKKLSKTLLTLARQGNCIFVGRGADLLLPPKVGFRVRLVAPTPNRLARFAETNELTENEARQTMQRVEADRRRFFHHHFGIDTDDPGRHDMTINLARFSCEQATTLILEARSIHHPVR